MSDHKVAVEMLKRNLDYLNAERDSLAAQVDDLNEQIDSIETTVGELTSPTYKASFTFDDWDVVSRFMDHPITTSVIPNGRN